MTDKLLWALTDKASDAVQTLIDFGFDRDLALYVLERLWPEEAIYEIERG